MNNKVLAFKDSHKQNFPVFNRGALKSLQQGMGLDNILWPLREKSWLRLESLPCPHYSDETWRYTKLELFPWELLSAGSAFSSIASFTGQKNLNPNQVLNFSPGQQSLKCMKNG